MTGNVILMITLISKHILKGLIQNRRTYKLFLTTSYFSRFNCLTKVPFIWPPIFITPRDIKVYVCFLYLFLFNRGGKGSYRWRRDEVRTSEYLGPSEVSSDHFLKDSSNGIQKTSYIPTSTVFNFYLRSRTKSRSLMTPWL